MSYIDRRIVFTTDKCNIIDQITPNCGTMFCALYDNNKKIMIGKTESNSIQNVICSKINKEILKNTNFEPECIYIFKFSDVNIIKLTDVYPDYPTVSQFDKHINNYFTHSVYKQHSIKKHTDYGVYTKHYGKKNNTPIDPYEFLNFFSNLGFEEIILSELNIKNDYWYYTKDIDYNISCEEIYNEDEDEEDEDEEYKEDEEEEEDDDEEYEDDEEDEEM
jgi:hypothetical protein